MTEPHPRRRGITVQYGGVVALDAIDFTAGEHAITGLVGPNGAGKTTLFGVLSGLVRPRAGQVLLGGHDVTRGEPAEARPPRASHGPSSGSSCSASSPCASTSSSPPASGSVATGRCWRDLIGRGSRPAAGEDETVDGTSCCSAWTTSPNDP